MYLILKAQRHKIHYIIIIRLYKFIIYILFLVYIRILYSMDKSLARTNLASTSCGMRLNVQLESLLPGGSTCQHIFKSSSTHEENTTIFNSTKASLRKCILT